WIDNRPIFPAAPPSDPDLTVKRRRIPVILMLDDPAIDDLHEAAPQNAERFSGRRLAERWAQKGAGHDPLACGSFRRHGAARCFHLEIRESYERTLEEGSD